MTVPSVLQRTIQSRTEVVIRGVFGIALFKGNVFTNPLQLSFSQHCKGYHHSQTVRLAPYLPWARGRSGSPLVVFASTERRQRMRGVPPPPHKTHSDLDVSLSVQT